MDEALVGRLEAAIADSGTLLVRAQKYRRASRAEGAELRRSVLALGDAARRLHRHLALDAATAGRLLVEADRLLHRLQTFLDGVRAAPEYRAAVDAFVAADAPALARLLPEVFTDLEPVPAPPDLFHALGWLQRGRLRPPADVVADARAACLAGLAAEGDDLSPGADPELPAVTLGGVPPPEAPIVLYVAGGALVGPVHRLAEADEHLIHAAHVRMGGIVRVPEALDLTEELRVAIAPPEWTRWRGELLAALVAAGVPVAER